MRRPPSLLLPVPILRRTPTSRSLPSAASAPPSWRTTPSSARSCRRPVRLAAAFAGLSLAGLFCLCLCWCFVLLQPACCQRPASPRLPTPLWPHRLLVRLVHQRAVPQQDLPLRRGARVALHHGLRRAAGLRREVRARATACEDVRGCGAVAACARPSPALPLHAPSRRWSPLPSPRAAPASATTASATRACGSSPCGTCRTRRAPWSPPWTPP